MTLRFVQFSCPNFVSLFAMMMSEGFSLLLTRTTQPPSNRDGFPPLIKSSGVMFKSSSAEVIQAYSKSVSIADLRMSSSTSGVVLNNINGNKNSSISNNNKNNQSFSSADFRKTIAATPSLVSDFNLIGASLSAVGRSTSLNAIATESGGYSKKDRASNTPYDKIWTILENDNDEVNMRYD